MKQRYVAFATIRAC